MKTTLVKEADIVRKWYLVDAAGQPLGRLAVKIAHLLRGKNKVTFAPHIDQGDFVVVINASKVKLSGAKEEQKIYKHYTGYPSGLREFPAKTVRAKNPTRLITQAVLGMLPDNKQSRQMERRLRVFAGAEHEHTAQQPEAITL
jgi:large subunit ribosomal protein L13